MMALVAITNQNEVAGIAPTRRSMMRTMPIMLQVIIMTTMRSEMTNLLIVGKMNRAVMKEVLVRWKLRNLVLHLLYFQPYPKILLPRMRKARGGVETMAVDALSS